MHSDPTINDDPPAPVVGAKAAKSLARQLKGPGSSAARAILLSLVDRSWASVLAEAGSRRGAYRLLVRAYALRDVIPRTEPGSELRHLLGRYAIGLVFTVMTARPDDGDEIKAELEADLARTTARKTRPIPKNDGNAPAADARDRKDNTR